MKNSLHKFIPTKEFKFWDLCFYRIIDLYLPTEVVVTKPQIVTPQVARCSFHDLFYTKDGILTYDELYASSPKPFCGSASYAEVCILEAWEEWGSDGHTDYKHDGFIFVLEHEIKEALKTKEYPVDFVRKLRWEEDRRKEKSK